MSDKVSLSAQLKELEKKVGAAVALVRSLKAENGKLKTALTEKAKELSQVQSQLSASTSETGQQLLELQEKIRDLEVNQSEHESWEEKKEEIRTRLLSVMKRLENIGESIIDIGATENREGKHSE